MTKPSEAAHFVVYGTTADNLMAALGDDGIARVSETILNNLDAHGDGIASEHGLSAALVTGDRAEKLLTTDKDNW